MGARAARRLDGARVVLDGATAATRVTDADFATAPGRVEDIVDLRLARQPITRVPARLGRALRELTLEACGQLAGLAGIERCGGLSALTLAGFDAAWVQRELRAVAELPDLARLTLRGLRGGLDWEAVLALPALIELRLTDCAIDRTSWFTAIGERGGGLRRLALDASAAWRLWEDVGGLRGLTSLELGACVELPASLGKLDRLERLVVDGRRRAQRVGLRAVPAGIGGCRALRELVIEGPIERLPEQLGRCAALEVLTLRRTALTELPDAIGGLRALRRLEVGSRAKVVTARAGVVEKLRLDAYAGDPAIGARVRFRPVATPEGDDVVIDDAARIPDDFGDPVRLTVSLPTYRGPLPQLARLARVRAASLAVGGDVGEMVAALPGVEELTLVGREVPEAIGGLARLRVLRVAGPHVRGLPATLARCAALRRMIVDAPMLARIDALPAALEELVLANAGCARLPASVIEAPAVRAVTIGRWTKPARDLRGLAAMPALRALVLHEPPALTALVDALAEAGRLTSLALADRGLRELPAGLGALPLVELDVRATGVRALPASLRTCHALARVVLPVDFLADPRPQLPPGAWAPAERTADRVVCERYRARGKKRT